MTLQLRPPRPAAQHVSERDNIILKAVIHELSLELDTDLIPTAHAVGIDRSAIRLAQALAERAPVRAEA